MCVTDSQQFPKAATVRHSDHLTMPPVFAHLTFHVRNEAVSEFSAAAADLLETSRSDRGFVRFDIHKELPWARCISNEEFSLFMMTQQWASPSDLEAHMGSEHAQRFSSDAVSKRMLVNEPSVSIVGVPLTESDLAVLGAEAAAELAAISAETMARAECNKEEEHIHRSAMSSSNTSALGNSGPLNRSASSSRAASRSSTLQQSGSLILKK